MTNNIIIKGQYVWDTEIEEWIKVQASFQHKIIDKAMIHGDDAPTTYELDLSQYDLAVITYSLGEKTGNPTVNFELQFVDSNGNIIEDNDYPSKDVSDTGTGYSHKILDEAYKTALITITPSGQDTDTFALSTIEVQAKSA